MIGLLMLVAMAVGAGGPPGPLAGIRVTLDPGHPSEVGRGTTGKRISELEVCWRVAKLARAALEADGATVCLTKSRMDEMVPNQRRAEIANDFRADLMVRLHCDAASARGFSVYYPSTTGTANGFRGPSASVLARSKSFAQVFHPALRDALGGALNDRGLMTDRQTSVGARQGALTGSIYSQVPVLLIEMVVLTDPKDEAWILVPKNQLRYGKAIATAVRAVVAAPGFHLP